MDDDRPRCVVCGTRYEIGHEDDQRIFFVRVCACVNERRDIEDFSGFLGAILRLKRDEPN